MSKNGLLMLYFLQTKFDILDELTKKHSKNNKIQNINLSIKITSIVSYRISPTSAAITGGHVPAALRHGGGRSRGRANGERLRARR